MLKLPSAAAPSPSAVLVSHYAARDALAIDPAAIHDHARAILFPVHLFAKGRTFCPSPQVRSSGREFKHALIRDAAYGSLLRKTHEEMHVRIARVLEEMLPETPDIQPELIAHHYTEAGCNEEAVRWWHSAGQRASHRSANAEAVAHLNKALELIGTGAEGNKRDLLELTVRVDVGGPLIGSKGWGASELEENYTRAWALYERTGATEQAFPVLWGQYVSAGYRAEGGMALSEERAERFLHWRSGRGMLGLR